MKHFSIFLAILFATLAVNSTFAQSGRTSVKQAAADIEAGTSTKEAISNRQEALKWTIETDEISLIACGGTFGPFVDKKNKNGPELTEAYMIGMAAYRRDNPNENENAVQQAGVELALKVYDRIIKEKPKTKFKAVDDLIAKRDNGELAGFIAAAYCGKK
jgi:hypothetical protein